MKSPIGDLPVIFIDGRVFSTDAYDRGMGRYVRFLMEKVSEAGFHLGVILYKNSRLSASEFPVSACKYSESIDFDPAVTDEREMHHSSFAIEEVLSKYKAAAFIDATPFVFPMRYDVTVCPVIAVAYDLIPLKYSREYQSKVPLIVKEMYRNGLRRLIKADFIIHSIF